MFEPRLEGTFRVESCPKRLIDLDPLRSQMLKDVIKIGLSSQSIVGVQRAKGCYEYRIIVVRHLETGRGESDKQSP